MEHARNVFQDKQGRIHFFRITQVLAGLEPHSAIEEDLVIANKENVAEVLTDRKGMLRMTMSNMPTSAKVHHKTAYSIMRTTKLCALDACMLGALTKIASEQEISMLQSFIPPVCMRAGADPVPSLVYNSTEIIPRSIYQIVATQEEPIMLSSDTEAHYYYSTEMGRILAHQDTADDKSLAGRAYHATLCHNLSRNTLVRRKTTLSKISIFKEDIPCYTNTLYFNVDMVMPEQSVINTKVVSQTPGGAKLEETRMVQMTPNYITGGRFLLSIEAAVEEVSLPTDVFEKVTGLKVRLPGAQLPQFLNPPMSSQPTSSTVPYIYLPLKAHTWKDAMQAATSPPSSSSITMQEYVRQITRLADSGGSMLPQASTQTYHQQQRESHLAISQAHGITSSHVVEDTDAPPSKMARICDHVFMDHAKTQEAIEKETRHRILTSLPSKLASHRESAKKSLDRFIPKAADIVVHQEVMDQGMLDSSSSGYHALLPTMLATNSKRKALDSDMSYKHVSTHVSSTPPHILNGRSYSSMCAEAISHINSTWLRGGGDNVTI